MKSPFFALLLLFLSSSVLTAGEPEQTYLSGYYTPDIVRNSLQFQLNSTSQFNSSENSNEIQKVTNSSETLDLKGQLIANLQRYTNTRKLISTLTISGSTSNGLVNQLSEVINTQQLMPSRSKYQLTDTRNQLGADWLNNRYLADKLFIYYSLGTGLTHNYSFTKTIVDSDLRSYENKSSVSYQAGSLTTGLGVGIGRIERVEDMRHAIYIVDELKKQGRLNRSLTSDELFRLSQLISSVKNKRFLDARLHLMDEISTVDAFLKGNGLIENSDAVYFTSLYDMWQHGDLFERKSGSELRLRFLPRITLTKNTDYLKSVIPDTSHLIIDRGNSFYGSVDLTYTYEKPFRLNWQHSVRAGAFASLSKYSLNEDKYPDYTSAEVFGGYQLGYYPSTRTYLQAGISQSFWSGKYNNESDRALLAQTDFQSSVYYYISRQLRVGGSFNVNWLWNQVVPTTSNNLSGRLNFTINYFLF